MARWILSARSARKVNVIYKMHKGCRKSISFHVECKRLRRGFQSARKNKNEWSICSSIDGRNVEKRLGHIEKTFASRRTLTKV